MAWNVVIVRSGWAMAVSSCTSAFAVPWSIFTAALWRISPVTWEWVFRAIALDTWPRMVDRVLMSIPWSRAFVAKVCLRL